LFFECRVNNLATEIAQTKSRQSAGLSTSRTDFLRGDA
jgi:hypothetical protein